MRHPDPNSYKVEYLPPIAESAPATSATNAKISPRKTDIRSAAELCQKQFEPVRYIVPGYIAEGCTLLAGRPKLGKSWLMLEIALAVAQGDTCLGGILCEQGNVLYLALEDNERRLKDRIGKVLGQANGWPKELQYVTEWPRAN